MTDSVSITSWVSRHATWTFRTRLVELPAEFVAYLRCEGPMVLPKTATDKDDDDDDGMVRPEFAELEGRIEREIASLGGAAFAKLNWSAPRDAHWIIGGLECRRATDVFSLLKASEFAAYDLSLAEEPTLALREWRRIDPATEFRCFVRGRSLVAACQRRVDARYDSNCALVATRLASCFDEYLRGDALLPTDFVFDVVLDLRRTWLVDLNVFGPPTDPLLFAWDDIAAPPKSSDFSSFPEAPTDPRAVELRLIDDVPGCSKPRVTASELSRFRAPRDVVDLAAAGGIDGLVDLVDNQQQHHHHHHRDAANAEQQDATRM